MATSMKPTEHQIQCAFIEWCARNEKKYPGLRLGFAVPNGGLRNKATAGKLKAEGVRAGVPDWMCPVPVAKWQKQHSYLGLAIEFKVRPNKLTDAQCHYIADLLAQGWLVEVCYSREEAIKTVERYFESC